MKQYLEQANIDTLYQGGFNKQIKDIEERVQKLRGISTPTESKNSADQEICDFEDEETTIKKIIEKVHLPLKTATSTKINIVKNLYIFFLGKGRIIIAR